MNVNPGNKTSPAAGADWIKSLEKDMNCAVISSGCKLNQFEASQFESLLKQMNPGRDIKITNLKPNEKSRLPIDMFIVNTCTVTEKAETETGRIIRKIQKNYPGSRIVVTGCSVQAGLSKISGSGPDLSGIILVDNVKKAELLKEASIKYPEAILSQARVRPYLKIQEGCELNCSYCIIPSARPARWSMDIENVLYYINEFEKRGYKEVILSGVNIGAFSGGTANSDDQAQAPPHALKKLLRSFIEIKSAIKLRLSSIDPFYLDDELIEIITASEKIQKHFHIPLQSGCDRILGLMNRRYSFLDYEKIISKIAAKLPDAAIGTDIISGFPGETAEDFLETERNLRRLPIYYIHAFSYSDRPGTKSHSFGEKVAEKEIKRRTSIIRRISDVKRMEFYRKFDGRFLEFITLPGSMALSSNYIKAEITAMGGGGFHNIPPGTIFSGRLGLDTEKNAGCDNLNLNNLYSGNFLHVEVERVYGS